VNPHYPDIQLELRALPLIEKFASVETDAEVVVCAQEKAAQVCSDVIQTILEKSAVYSIEMDRWLNEKEMTAVRAVKFAMSLRDTHATTGEKLAASPEETAELLQKFATAIYLDRVLDEQRQAGVKEAAECQALGREYAVEILRSLLA
jgi:hypothetical protein